MSFLYTVIEYLKIKIEIGTNLRQEFKFCIYKYGD